MACEISLKKSLTIGIEKYYLVMARQCRLAVFPKGKENFHMANSTQQRTDNFVIENPTEQATYGMVRKLASYFSKSTKCPKDIKWGTLHGHFLQKLNDKKEPLVQGEVARLLTLKSIPAENLKAMRSYKKLVAIES